MPTLIGAELTLGDGSRYCCERVPSMSGQVVVRLVNLATGAVYHTSPVSCCCRGFVRHGRCKHRDAVASLVASGVL